jgi:hypothetical protein
MNPAPLTPSFSHKRESGDFSRLPSLPARLGGPGWGRLWAPDFERVRNFAASHPLVSPAEAGAHYSAARTFHRSVGHCDCLASSEQLRDGSQLAPPNMSVSCRPTGRRQMVCVAARPAPRFFTRAFAGAKTWRVGGISSHAPKRASTALLISTLAFVFVFVASIAVHAEIVSVPPADPLSSAASLPPPTVLRGSPSSTARSLPICPPGYTLSTDYGCVAPSGGDYTEDSPGYDYWPDYGDGYPFGGFPGFGLGAGRFHRFAGSHGFHGLHGRAGFHAVRGFHGSAGFHGAARFGGFGAGIGHMGGFGRR